MNIGFDLDKIFISYPPFVPDALIERLYKKHKNGTLMYRIPSKAEQVFRSFTHYPLFRPPIKENIAFMEEFTKRNRNKYFLVSSRFGFLKERTLEIVKMYGIDKFFHGMHFNFDNMQPHLFKDAMIKKLHIDAYIDDDLPLITYLAQKNPKTSFFWLNNKLKKKLGKNINGITKISDIKLS